MGAVRGDKLVGAVGAALGIRQGAPEPARVIYRGYLLGEELSTGRRSKMLKRLTKGMVWVEGCLWKETEGGRLRVLRDAEEFEAVMREVHDGM